MTPCNRGMGSISVFSHTLHNPMFYRPFLIKLEIRNQEPWFCFALRSEYGDTKTSSCKLSNSIILAKTKNDFDETTMISYINTLYKEKVAVRLRLTFPVISSTDRDSVNLKRLKSKISKDICFFIFISCFLSKSAFRNDKVVIILLYLKPGKL